MRLFYFVITSIFILIILCMIIIAIRSKDNQPVFNLSIFAIIFFVVMFLICLLLFLTR